ncbi:hypothetical protein [Pantoea agglomerans]
MSSITAQILRSQTFHGISSAERSKNNFKWWIEGGNYTFTASAKKSFEIYAINAGDILKPLCHDIARFSSSAVESISNISDDPVFPKSNGWMSIRVYYSAFFAAHSLLRIYGRSCSYFNNKTMKSVNAILQQQQPGALKISDGNYLFKLNRNGNSIHINAKEINSSHAGLWTCFHELLEDLQTSIAATTTFTTDDKNECVSFLSTLSKRLKKGDDNGWLSTMRNEINYNHSKNSWTINHDRKSTDNNNIKMFSEKWLKPCCNDLFSKGLDEKIEFIETSSIIISMMKDLIVSIYEVDKTNFLRYTTIPTIRNFIQI